MCAPAAACETRRAHELLDGRIVGNLSVDHDAAVAVRRVLAQADIGDDDGFRRIAANRTHRFLHRPVADRMPPNRVVLRGGKPNSSTRRNALAPGAARLAHGLVHRELMHARHRGDLAANTGAVGDKERQDELVW